MSKIITFKSKIITFKSILFEKILKLLPIDIDVILWYNLFRRLKYLVTFKSILSFFNTRN